MAGDYVEKGEHKMSPDEMKVHGEMDLRTLIEAEKVKKDPARMKMAMSCRKDIMDSLEKVKANG